MGDRRLGKPWLVVVGITLSTLWVSQAVVAQDTFHLVNGSVGVGTGTPQATLQVQESDSAKFDRVLLRLTGESFAPQAEYEDGATGVIWRLGVNSSDHFVFNETSNLGVAELRITPDGRIFVNSTQVHPDYVFAPDYPLLPLNDLEEFIEQNGHLPGVLTAEERDREGGIDLTSLPLQLLKKVEELSLYTIDQQRLIQDLRASNSRLSARLEALERKVSSSRR